MNTDACYDVPNSNYLSQLQISPKLAYHDQTLQKNVTGEPLLQPVIKYVFGVKLPSGIFMIRFTKWFTHQMHNYNTSKSSHGPSLSSIRVRGDQIAAYRSYRLLYNLLDAAYELEVSVATKA